LDRYLGRLVSVVSLLLLTLTFWTALTADDTPVPNVVPMFFWPFVFVGDVQFH